MSYTELFVFNEKGNAEWAAEFDNAHRGAMAVWKRIEEKYLPPFLPDYSIQLGYDSVEKFVEKYGFKPSRTSFPDKIKEIWDLCEDERLSHVDKTCLISTFDKCLVKREHIPKLIQAYNEFDGDTNLKEQAEFLNDLLEMPGFIGVGWNQMSGNSDTWADYYPKEDNDVDEYESIPYNCLTGEEHFWLYKDN